MFIGKISYSLYLWHWPLLIYTEYWTLSPLRWPIRILIVTASVILATLSWRWVETPFRTRQIMPERRNLFGFGLATLACYLFLGGAVAALQGLPGRFPAASEQYANGRDDFPFNTQIGLAEARRGDFAIVGVNPPSRIHCMVWGDSHAMAIVPAIENLVWEMNSTAAVATYFATAPILGVQCTNPVSLRHDSDKWAQAVVDHVKSHQIPNVLLVCRWRSYQAQTIDDKSPSGPCNLASRIQETVLMLQKAGTRVWILKEVPTYGFKVPRALARAVIHGGPLARMGMREVLYAEASASEDSLLALAASAGATILDPRLAFVNQEHFCAIEDSGFALYRDNTHLSSHGAVLLKPLFRRIWHDQPQPASP